LPNRCDKWVLSSMENFAFLRAPAVVSIRALQLSSSQGRRAMARESIRRAAIRQELEHHVMRLYAEWPERETCEEGSKPFAFFVWLESRHPELTRIGLFGARGTYQHISALVARWDSVYSDVDPNA